MSSLTEEQKRRMEANRLKALVKLKEKKNLTDSNRSNGLISSNKSSTIGASNKNNFTSYVQNQNRNSSELKSKPSVFYSSKESSSFFSGKRITGCFTLISKDRFIVDVAYHGACIEVFKTILSKQYDSSSRKWSFGIEDHNKLASALESLRPELCIGTLPKFVLKSLQMGKKYPPLNSVDLCDMDPSLLEAFFSFQREGVCFGITRGGRVLIADDMGLGKTVQALGIASYYRQEWPLLIVAPSSVRYSWAEAVDRWIMSVCPEDISMVNTGKDSLSGSVVIMSYDILSKKAKAVKEKNFGVVIMDESHLLKSFKTARYKSAAPIMQQCRRLILLSGTPALSRPSELYTQISAIDKNVLPSFQEYGIRYCNGHENNWGWDYSGSSNMEELQVVLHSTIVLRRLKADVIQQLPSKQRMTVMLDPTSVENSTKAMEAVSAEFSTCSKSHKHAMMLEYFSHTAHAKAKAAADYIKDMINDGKKFLVFAHHKVMMDKLCCMCENTKTKYIRIDGATTSEARHRLVETFQVSNDVRVAVLSITAANTGITLTAAQLVLFAELFWNPGHLVQAEDRAHRIGQQDSVLVQYLVAKGTVDDYIWPMIQAKVEILGKAGLTKENFSRVESVNQKANEENTIEKYLIESQDIVDEFDADFDEEPASKKIKKDDDS